MSYDDRLIIYQKFKAHDKELSNRLKLINQGEYIQVYVKSDKDKFGQMRWNKEAVEKIIKYLQDQVYNLK